MKVIKSWEQLEVSLLQQTKVFDLYRERLKSPSSTYEDDFYTIRFVDWVNIVALTEQQEVVLVEQFRFGIRQNTLELPGGMLDSEQDDPKAAAIRELAEETGYRADDAELLGMVHPNPAIQNNRCHSFLARNVRLEGSQSLDPAEDIAVHLVPLHDIPMLLAEGRITHSLVICAIARLFARGMFS